MAAGQGKGMGVSALTSYSPVRIWQEKEGLVMCSAFILNWTLSEYLGYKKKLHNII